METTTTPTGRKIGKYFLFGSMAVLALAIVISFAANREESHDAAATQAAKDASYSASAAAEAAKPPSIVNADPSIYNVHVADGVLQIHVHDMNPANETDLVNSAGAMVHKIGTAIGKGAPEVGNATKIVIHFDALEKDRLGHQLTSQALVLGFQASDFKNAQWDNLTNAEALNLVQAAKLDLVGRNAVLSWCANPANRAPALCQVALR